MMQVISDADVKDKRVFVRVDFNVPLNPDGSVADEMRIAESLPTIRSIVDRGGIAILASHMGRPAGARNAKYSLKVVAERLRQLLPCDVVFADDCIGPAAEDAVRSAGSGSVVLLENLRFYQDEEDNKPEFAAALASLADIYCNDAFGAAHRAHASTSGMAYLFQRKYAGLLMKKEIDYLGAALVNPKRPLVSIMGGSKISGKIDVINSLIDKCDSILIGGGMTFTFLRALGYRTGSSIVEEDKVELAESLLKRAEEENVSIVLPSDVVVATSFDNNAERKTVQISGIEDGWMGLDNGEQTTILYSDIISQAGTVLWNGPMGVFEFVNFSHGTLGIARAMAEATEGGAITIVGGGDSAAAITQFGYHSNVSHVSTGGGASLEFLEGKTLPGVAALLD